MPNAHPLLSVIQEAWEGFEPNERLGFELHVGRRNSRGQLEQSYTMGTADDFWLEPCGEHLQLEALANEICSDHSADARSALEHGVLVALVMVPWQRMIIDGARGLRVGFLQAGAIADRITRSLLATGAIAICENEFFDDKVNAQFRVDGLERLVVSVIMCDSPRAPGGAALGGKT